MGFGSIGSKMKSSFFSASGKEITGGNGANESDSQTKGASSARGAANQNNNQGAQGQAQGGKSAAAGSKTDAKPKPQTMKISKVLAQNIIFNTMSQFINYFVNLKLPFESSRELLMHFCKKYELD